MRSSPRGLEGARPKGPVRLGPQKLLIGRSLDDALIAAGAEAAFKPAKPLDNTDFHMTWRKEMVREYVARALAGVRGDASCASVTVL